MTAAVRAAAASGGCGLLDRPAGSPLRHVRLRLRQLAAANRAAAAIAAVAMAAAATAAAATAAISTKVATSDDEAAPAAPAEAGASVRPIPPRPMADPNASIGQQRNVVRTSFLR